METTKSTRIVNEYRAIYFPEHPKAMTSDNWEGYIYEHIVVAEEQLGRSIRSNEVVHHLDFNRSNNRHENLLVLERGQHAKLHVWLDKGAPGWQQSGENRVNSRNPKVIEPSYCLVCARTLQDRAFAYCSPHCRISDSRKVERPSLEQLQEDIDSMPWTSVGKKYGVSDNAIRNWAKNYGITKATLSQARSTLLEGAETTGEVQSS